MNMTNTNVKDAPQSSDNKRDNTSSQYKSSRLLIVDDEASNVKLLERVLVSDGYTNVITTQNPLDVVKLYQQHDPDIVLLDLNMPYMDGYEVMEALQETAGESICPVLVLTAQHFQEHKQRALDGGAQDYVTKPFDRKELLSRVRNLLEVRLARKYMSDQNNLLEQRVFERTQELQFTQEMLYESRMQIVRRLGRAAEYRDNETGLHIIRMSKISALMGEAMGMNAEQCNLLLNASPMHDIGKIGIPDSILLKPGKLDAEEWEVMKTHAQIGADILSGDDSDVLVMARDIALTHHEKWDGSGYPNSLKGDDIPMVGRVTAIADVFDALTSERPYKKAWPVEKALDLIKGEKDRHFDPAVVDKFFEILPDINDVMEKYAEPEQQE